jgi:hypothetical protein
MPVSQKKKNEFLKHLKYMKDNKDPRYDEYKKKVDDYIREQEGERAYEAIVGPEKMEQVAEKAAGNIKAAGLGLAQAPAFGFLDEAAEAVGLEDTAKSMRELAEEYPVGYTAGQMYGGGVVGKALKKIPKLSGMMGQAAETGLATAGEAEGDLGDKVAAGTLGAGFGAIAGLVGKMFASPFDDPTRVRARSLGAQKKHFKGNRFKDVEGTVKRVNEGMGDVFTHKPVKFDSEQGIFVPSKTGRKVSARTRAEYLEDFKKRFQDGIKVITRQLDDQMKVAESSRGVEYTLRDLFNDPEVADIGKWFNENKIVMGLDDDEGVNNFLFKKFYPVFRQLKEAGHPAGTKDIPITALQKMKRDLYKAGAEIFDGPQTTTREKSLKRFYEKAGLAFKRIIEREAGMFSDANIGTLNRKLGDLIELESMTDDYLAAVKKAGEGGKPLVAGGYLYMVTRLLNDTITESLSPLTIARTQELLDSPASGGLKGKLLRQGKQLGRGATTRGTSILVAPEEQDETPIEVPRRPQSIVPENVRTDSMGEPFNFSQELEATGIPRSSKAIIENKDFVKAKVAQQYPEMFPVIETLLDRNVHMIDKVMPGLMAQMPDLFEYSEFNDFNGIPSDPASKALFAQKKFSEYREGKISSTEYAQLIQKLNTEQAVV